MHEHKAVSALFVNYSNLFIFFFPVLNDRERKNLPQITGSYSTAIIEEKTCPLNCCAHTYANLAIGLPKMGKETFIPSYRF